MIDPVRRRRSYREILYGPYAQDMDPESTYFADVRDRAAFAYLTGINPSHLRREYNGALQYLSRDYRTQEDQDRQVEREFINPRIVADLRLDEHPMVIETRRYISRGYLLKGSRGFAARRSYRNIYLFKVGPDQNIIERLTVKLDGAVKQGWGEGF